MTLTTGQLIIKDGAAITVSSQARKNVIYIGDPNNLGKAGYLNITARSILLDNKGKLISNSESGKGGNITLQVQNLLLMRRESQITTNAGTTGLGGDGGNIIINAPNGFIVATPWEITISPPMPSLTLVVKSQSPLRTFLDLCPALVQT